MYNQHAIKDSGLAHTLAAAPISVLMTILLMYLMHALVYREYSPPIDEVTTVIPDVWADPRTPIKPIFEPITKPAPVEEPPNKIETPNSTPKENTPTTLKAPELKIDTDLGKLIKNGGGNYPISQVFASPRYPQRALTRGIEGWVDVRFDINRYGSTENISIVSAKPEGYFENAAIRAAQKWKYQPFTNDNGEPIPFAGLTKRLIFEIEK